MANAHKKITITIPNELDRLLDALVKESKKTAKPITKSSLITCSVYEYLANAQKELKAEDKGGIN